MAAGGDLGRPSRLDWGRKVSLSISLRDHNPNMERKELMNVVNVGSGGVGGSRSLWNSRNLTTRTNQCQLFVSWGWALLGELKPCPSPPRPFLFWRGWGEGRGPALCVVGGGVGVGARISGSFLMQAL